VCASYKKISGIKTENEKMKEEEKGI